MHHAFELQITVSITISRHANCITTAASITANESRDTRIIQQTAGIEVFLYRLFVDSFLLPLTTQPLLIPLNASSHNSFVVHLLIMRIINGKEGDGGS
jgi:hypothetical protein